MLNTVPQSNTIQRSYKFRIYPNTTQCDLLSQCFGIARFSYNMSLDAISVGYRTQGQKFNWVDCSKALTQLSREPEYDFLKIAPRTIIDQSLRNLDKAFKHFFAGRAKYPTFKKKMHAASVSFQLDQRLNNWLSGKMLKLPKLGCLNVKWSRIPTGRPKTATVSRTASGKYFVSLSVEETIACFPKTGKACGIDVGIKNLAITHNFESGAPKYTNKYARALKIAQRRLARKVKGSKRWHHARIKVARIHEKIKNSRADFVHNVSTQLIKSHDDLGIETFNAFVGPDKLLRMSTTTLANTREMTAHRNKCV